MAYLQLGRSDIKVPRLCFGCNVFGWTATECESFDLLDRLRDVGLTFLDTADMYSRWVPGHIGGESEAIIGRWLQSRGGRDRMIIATKVGGDMGENGGGLSARHIEDAVEASLMRLRTDYVDLYQSHYDDETVPLDETLGAFANLVKIGKVRVIGASNHSAERFMEALDLSEAAGLPRYESLQPLYNLIDRTGFEDELANICADRKVGVLPFSSLASGFLTGKYRTAEDLVGQPRGNSVQQYMGERGSRILAALDTVAKHHDVQPAVIALAWLMSQSAVTAPIVSASNVDQVDALVRALTVTLDPVELQMLRTASN
jgi:aryl-alcohol dehydrogenase-like predicted oxidoreductase